MLKMECIKYVRKTVLKEQHKLYGKFELDFVICLYKILIV